MKRINCYSSSFIVPSLLTKLSQILPRAFFFPFLLCYRFLGCNSPRPGALSVFSSYNYLIKVSALVDQKPFLHCVSSFQEYIHYVCQILSSFVYSLQPVYEDMSNLSIFKTALLEDTCLFHSCQSTSGRTNSPHPHPPRNIHRNCYYLETVESSVSFFAFPGRI